MTYTAYYTTSSVATFMSRRFAATLRYHTALSQFESLSGSTWNALTYTQVDLYVQEAFHILLAHAMDVDVNAANDLYSMDNDSGHAAIQTSLQSLIAF